MIRQTILIQYYWIEIHLRSLSIAPQALICTNFSLAHRCAVHCISYGIWAHKFRFQNFISVVLHAERMWKKGRDVMIEIALIKYNRTPGRFLGIDTDFFFIFAGWTWAIDFIYDSQSRHFRSPYCDFFLSLDFLNVCHLCRLKCFHSRSWWYFLFNEKKKHVNISDSLLAFDLLTLSHLVTAVTFHMTFCVWLTITVNNIARKQDIKVNKMFTRMLENKWKNERIWNEEGKKDRG